ncbi:hypothetical protein VFPFJ_05685 [Purpureocillium lilacinum]|uniref:Uncharacterized protein n=1 Tax=Purpureocillium lilacinum TaxID=33203 RepID=A0A179H433_PURLI|nr:hypothetical protein VFPFJ_05685 [Purpureocillium lilacinum]OAQ84732.1 hypothetical protein VFPBJ_03500 [Purpureocillium lilacinum]OAQ89276.1 hypothetical protein VFPFJ_05685 [Purpureocillium lilacinum]
MDAGPEPATLNCPGSPWQPRPERIVRGSPTGQIWNAWTLPPAVQTAEAEKVIRCLHCRARWGPGPSQGKRSSPLHHSGLRNTTPVADVVITSQPRNHSRSTTRVLRPA